MAKEATEVALAMVRPLDRAFFGRDPRRVARELLGKVLVRGRVGQPAHPRQNARDRLAARIVEVEAYLGEKDPASHAAAGNTARTSVLFGPPGFAYVYFICGKVKAVGFYSGRSNPCLESRKWLPPAAWSCRALATFQNSPAVRGGWRRRSGLPAHVITAAT
jgi:hypothetical protein